MDDKKIRVVVAAHKPYPMPADPMYLPLHVGAALSKQEMPDTFSRDDSGDNISVRNPGYCELTGLYWAWKNLPEEYIGLVHYRRHFTCEGRKGRAPSDAIRFEELAPLIESYEIFVPRKRHYVVETLYSHYAHTHYPGHLDRTRQLLERQCPACLPSFDHVMQQREGYMFNMAIMRRDLLDRYCSWLFPLLFALEEELTAEEKAGRAETLSAYQGRLYGRVSELLFNVFLDYEMREGALESKKLKELPYFNTEKTNWGRKGSAFLGAKLLHKKYSGSF